MNKKWHIMTSRSDEGEGVGEGLLLGARTESGTDGAGGVSLSFRANFHLDEDSAEKLGESEGREDSLTKTNQVHL